MKQHIPDLCIQTQQQSGSHPHTSPHSGATRPVALRWVSYEALYTALTCYPLTVCIKNRKQKDLKTLTRLLSAEQCWGTKSGASGLSTELLLTGCVSNLWAAAVAMCGDFMPPVDDGGTGWTVDSDGKRGEEDAAGKLWRAGWMFKCCGLARAGFAMHGDGDGDRKTGATGETWAGTGKGSDADVIKGMSPLTAAECVSDRLLAERGETADGLRSAWAGWPDACSLAMSAVCNERVGVECEGTGGDSENSGAAPGELASLLFNGKPGGFTGEGEPCKTGGLHCSDTHCTWPGGLACKPDGDGDPEAYLSKPRPRLCPTATVTTQCHTVLSTSVLLAHLSGVTLG